ncbi:MAG: hypothetical protein V1926_05885 [Candidatus Peregrinibacteria bacterium]
MLFHGITVELSAAKELRRIADREGRKTACVRIVTEESGELSLSLVRRIAKSDRVFSHGDVPTVRVGIAPDLLLQIDGAVLTLREGRLTLDLPERACGGSCEECTGECCRVE